VDWLALCPSDRQAGNGDRLAPTRISAVLELEKSPSTGPAFDLARTHRSDPQDEFGQSSLGRSPHPRGTLEAGVRAIRSNGCEVYGASSKDVLSDLANRITKANNARKNTVGTTKKSEETISFLWFAKKLLEAFPWDSAPRYLLRDRDGSYGEKFREAARWLGIREILTAPQSPWQNAYVERLIGSIRRECLDHVIILNETGLRRMLKSYFEYYERTRTHLSLDKDAPVGGEFLNHAAMGV
jgi:Integrase core domain